MSRKLSLKSFYGEMPNIAPSIDQQADENFAWEDQAEYQEPQFDDDPLNYPEMQASSIAPSVGQAIDGTDADDPGDGMAAPGPSASAFGPVSAPSPTSATYRIEQARADAAAQAAAQAGVKRGRLARFARLNMAGALGGVDYYAHDANIPVSPSGLTWEDTDRFTVGINEDADEAGVNTPGSLADDNLGPNPDSLPIPRGAKMGGLRSFGRLGRLARFGAAGAFRGLGDVAAGGVGTVTLPTPDLWGLVEMALLGIVAAKGIRAESRFDVGVRVAAGVLLAKDVLSLLSAAPQQGAVISTPAGTLQIP